MRSKARDIAKADAAILAKLLVTVTCAVWLFFPLETFNGWGGLRGHLLYGFSHANVFHCAANLLCMWLIRFRIRWVACYALSVLCSYIPCAVWDWGSISFVAEPTCGLSGLLICAVGMEWGRYGMLLKMMRHVGLPLVVFGLVPHVNMLLHLWCLMAGWMYGFLFAEAEPRPAGKTNRTTRVI